MTPFIIAEMGASHCGDLEIAREIVDAAAMAGADAVKLQTFDPAQMAIPGHLIKSGPWRGQDLLQLYEKTVTPRAWHEELFDLIRKKGMIPMSTPFHPDDVQFLESVGCERYKIASFEIGWIDLIAEAEGTGKPLYISTGMATREEIARAAVWGSTLMHCVSAYPSTITGAALGRMEWLDVDFGCDVGLSDHSPGWMLPVMATTLGASAIEKHIKLGWLDGGADDSFAMTPLEFRGMVNAVRDASKAMDTSPSEEESASKALRRSLWFAQDLPRGTELLPEHFKAARPWSGVPCSLLNDLVGTVLDTDVKRGEAPG